MGNHRIAVPRILPSESHYSFILTSRWHLIFSVEKSSTVEFFERGLKKNKDLKKDWFHSESNRILFLLDLSYLFCAHVVGVCGCPQVTKCEWRSEDNLRESILSIYHAGLRNETQVVGLGLRHLHLLRHLTSQRFYFSLK